MDEEQTKNKANKVAARNAAKKLLKDANITDPAVQIKDIFPIVKQTFDVTITGVDDRIFSGKADAVTQARDKSIFILYNKSRAVVRQRFSVAHEIGHLYMGHLHGNSSMDNGTDNFDEIEANEFAACLLMPPDMLRRDVRAGMKDTQAIADRYGVSQDALWIQLTNTNILKDM